MSDFWSLEDTDIEYGISNTPDNNYDVRFSKYSMDRRITEGNLMWMNTELNNHITQSILTLKLENAKADFCQALMATFS